MLRRRPNADDRRLGRLDLNQAPISRCCVVTLSGGRKQIETVTVGSKNLANAANQMTVGRKLPPRKKRFEFLDDAVERAHEPRYLVN